MASIPFPGLNLVPTAADTPRMAPRVRMAPESDVNPAAGTQPGANRGNFTANGTTQRLRTVMRRVRLRQGCERGRFLTLWRCPAGRGIAIAQETPRPATIETALCGRPGQAAVPIARLRPPSPGSVHLSPGSARPPLGCPRVAELAHCCRPRPTGPRRRTCPVCRWAIRINRTALRLPRPTAGRAPAGRRRRRRRWPSRRTPGVPCSPPGRGRPAATGARTRPSWRAARPAHRRRR